MHVVMDVPFVGRGPVTVVPEHVRQVLVQATAVDGDE